MQNCKPVSTPIVKEAIESGKDEEDDPKFLYREAVGALMYLMTGSRPDLAYAVGVCSRSLDNPSTQDYMRVKRIFRYIKGTMDLGIVYKHNYKVGYLKGFSDADHGGDVSTGRSTSGVLCMYSGGAVSWSSQRQSSVAISTTEAEIVAASECAKELVWLKTLFEGIVQLKDLPVLMVDNEAAIKLAQNPEFHKRTKHIRIRHFFVRELVLEGEIVIEKVDSSKQIADLMTKALFKPRLIDLRSLMGLR